MTGSVRAEGMRKYGGSGTSAPRARSSRAGVPPTGRSRSKIRSRTGPSRVSALQWNIHGVRVGENVTLPVSRISAAR